MIARDTFIDRRDNHCGKCEFWKGVCLKGHALQGPAGCPIRKFPPVDGADYQEDRPVEISQEVVGKCCDSVADDFQKITWAEAIAQLGESVDKWKRAGKPITPDKIYKDRVDTCKACDQYRLFQCRACKCIVIVKAKLLTETCPKSRWQS